MSKTMSRNLYLLGIVAAIIGGIFEAIAFAAGKTSTTAGGGSTTTPNGILFVLALIFFIAAAVAGTIAWIGALIRMVQLQHWVWFVLLLLISGIMMLIYIFFGPTRPANQPTNYPQFQQPGTMGPS